MKHRVDLKILSDVINPLSRVDRNMPVSLWGKLCMYMYEEIGVPAPLNGTYHTR